MKDKMSLTNIGNGAAVERFDIVLKEVLENMQDINTDVDFAREINLKVKFKPNIERQMGVIGITVTPKLAPLSSVVTYASLVTDIEGPEAYEVEAPKQMSLPIGNVTPIKKEKEKN